MRLDHRRFNVIVPQHFLDSPNVVSVLKQMSCEGMPKRLVSRALGQPRPRHRLLNRALDDRPVDVVVSLLASPMVNPTFLRKYP